MNASLKFLFGTYGFREIRLITASMLPNINAITGNNKEFKKLIPDFRSMAEFWVAFTLS